jgi:hypothetical protein
MSVIGSTASTVRVLTLYSSVDVLYAYHQVQYTKLNFFPTTRCIYMVLTVKRLFPYTELIGLFL